MFINARKIYHQIDRAHREYKPSQTEFIVNIVRLYRGEEYKVIVGDEDYKVDLLFFHRLLRCLVAVELKIGKFKPEYLGKMQFYLSALDEKEKICDENPSEWVNLLSQNSIMIEEKD